MAIETEVLHFLRTQFARVHERLDSLASDMSDLKGRVTALELSVAQLHGDFARQSLRLDRIELRRDRIERRIALPRPAAKAKAMTDTSEAGRGDLLLAMLRLMASSLDDFAGDGRDFKHPVAAHPAIMTSQRDCVVAVFAFDMKEHSDQDRHCPASASGPIASIGEWRSSPVLSRLPRRSPC
jgi:hypothetical protein